jgi:hypothetical protein
MSSEALCRIMDAEEVGSATRRLILIGLADSAAPDGRGEAALVDLARLGECDSGRVLDELEGLRTMDALVWMKHPEEAGHIVFGFRFAHEIYRRAK